MVEHRKHLHKMHLQMLPVFVLLLSMPAIQSTENVTMYGDGISVASAGNVAMFVLKAARADEGLAGVVVRATDTSCLGICAPFRLLHVFSDVGERESSVDYLAPTRSGLYKLEVLVKLQNQTNLLSSESEAWFNLQVLPQEADPQATTLTLRPHTNDARCPNDFYLTLNSCFPCVEPVLCDQTGYQVPAGSFRVLVFFADKYGNPASRTDLSVYGRLLLSHGFKRRLEGEALSSDQEWNNTVSSVHVNVQKSGLLTISMLLRSEHIVGSPFSVEVVPRELSVETSLLKVEHTFFTAGSGLDVAVEMFDLFENPVGDLTKCQYFKIFVISTTGGAGLRSCNNKGLCLFACTYDQVGDVNVSAVFVSPDGTPEEMKHKLVLQVRPGLPNALATSLAGAALSIATCGIVGVFSVYPRDQFGNLREEEEDVFSATLAGRSATDVLFSSRGGEHVGSYNVTRSGSYLLGIKLAGFLLVQHKEFLVRILPSPICSSRSFAQGTGLTLATAGLEASFAVHLRDQFGNVAYTPTENCSLLTFRLSTDVLVELPIDNPGLEGEEELDGRVRLVEYTSFRAGQYNVSLHLCATPLRATQGVATTVRQQRPSSSCSLVGNEVTSATAGQVYSFTVTTRDCFGSSAWLESSCLSPSCSSSLLLLRSSALLHPGHLLATYRVKAVRSFRTADVTQIVGDFAIPNDILANLTLGISTVRRVTWEGKIIFLQTGNFTLEYEMGGQIDQTVLLFIDNTLISSQTRNGLLFMTSSITIDDVSVAYDIRIELLPMEGESDIKTTNLLKYLNISTGSISSSLFGRNQSDDVCHVCVDLLHHQGSSITGIASGTYEMSTMMTCAATYSLIVHLLHPGGLMGQYTQDGLNYRRVDPAVNFDWGIFSPLPSFSPDDFQVRWSGLIKPSASAVFTFNVLCDLDNSFLLSIDDKIIVRPPGIEQADAPAEGTAELSKNRFYQIRLQYRDLGLHAKIMLRWKHDELTYQPITSENLFFSSDVLSGSPFLVAFSPSSVCSSTSLLTGDGGIRAAGQEETFVILLRDEYGNAAEGRREEVFLYTRNNVFDFLAVIEAQTSVNSSSSFSYSPQFTHSGVSDVTGGILKVEGLSATYYTDSQVYNSLDRFPLNLSSASWPSFLPEPAGDCTCEVATCCLPAFSAAWRAWTRPQQDLNVSVLAVLADSTDRVKVFLDNQLVVDQWSSLNVLHVEQKDPFLMGGNKFHQVEIFYKKYKGVREFHLDVIALPLRTSVLQQATTLVLQTIGRIDLLVIPSFICASQSSISTSSPSLAPAGVSVSFALTLRDEFGNLVADPVPSSVFLEQIRQPVQTASPLTRKELDYSSSPPSFLTPPLEAGNFSFTGFVRDCRGLAVTLFSSSSLQGPNVTTKDADLNRFSNVDRGSLGEIQSAFWSGVLNLTGLVGPLFFALTLSGAEDEVQLRVQDVLLFSQWNSTIDMPLQATLSDFSLFPQLSIVYRGREGLTLEMTHQGRPCDLNLSQRLCSLAPMLSSMAEVEVRDGVPSLRSVARGDGLTVATIGLESSFVVELRDQWNLSVPSSSSIRVFANVSIFSSPQGAYVSGAGKSCCSSSSSSSSYCVSFVPWSTGTFPLSVQSFARGGLLGCYFLGEAGGSPFLCRVDSVLKLNWSSPEDEALPPDFPLLNVTTRWTGLLLPALNETYTITPAVSELYRQGTSSCGSWRTRVWVDGKMLVEEIGLGGGGGGSGTVEGRAEESLDVMIEHRHSPRCGEFRLYWSSKSTIPSIVPSSRLWFSQTSVSSSPFPLLVRGSDVECSALLTATGSGLTLATAGEIATFRILVRDAFGNLRDSFSPNVWSVVTQEGAEDVKPSFSDPSGLSNTYTYTMERSGAYLLLVESLQRGGLTATYYAEETSSQLGVPIVDLPIYTKSEVAVNYDSNTSDALLLENSNRISLVRWQGLVKSACEQAALYNFSLLLLDGGERARLWVDNLLLIDQWTSLDSRERWRETKLDANSSWSRFLLLYRPSSPQHGILLLWSSNCSSLLPTPVSSDYFAAAVPAPASPFSLLVLAGPLCGSLATVSGASLSLLTAGVAGSFVVELRDAYGNAIIAGTSNLAMYILFPTSPILEEGEILSAFTNRVILPPGCDQADNFFADHFISVGGEQKKILSTSSLFNRSREVGRALLLSEPFLSLPPPSSPYHIRLLPNMSAVWIASSSSSSSSRSFFLVTRAGAASLFVENVAFGGLAATYYRVEKTTIPAASLLDQKIEFLGSDASGWPFTEDTNISSNFSAQWKGFVLPEYNQVYTFSITVARGSGTGGDEVNLWLEHLLLISISSSATATVYTGTFYFPQQSKLYLLELEYTSYSKQQRALDLRWETNEFSRTLAQEVVPSNRLLHPQPLLGSPFSVVIQPGLTCANQTIFRGTYQGQVRSTETINASLTLRDCYGNARMSSSSSFCGLDNADVCKDAVDVKLSSNLTDFDLHADILPAGASWGRGACSGSSGWSAGSLAFEILPVPSSLFTSAHLRISILTPGSLEGLYYGDARLQRLVGRREDASVDFSSSFPSLGVEQTLPWGLEELLGRGQWFSARWKGYLKPLSERKQLRFRTTGMAGKLQGMLACASACSQQLVVLPDSAAADDNVYSNDCLVTASSLSGALDCSGTCSTSRVRFLSSLLTSSLSAAFIFISDKSLGQVRISSSVISSFSPSSREFFLSPPLDFVPSELAAFVVLPSDSLARGLCEQVQEVRYEADGFATLLLLLPAVNASVLEADTVVFFDFSLGSASSTPHVVHSVIEETSLLNDTLIVRLLLPRSLTSCSFLLIRSSHLLSSNVVSSYSGASRTAHLSSTLSSPPSAATRFVLLPCTAATLSGILSCKDCGGRTFFLGPNASSCDGQYQGQNFLVFLPDGSIFSSRIVSYSGADKKLTLEEAIPSRMGISTFLLSTFQLYPEGVRMWLNGRLLVDRWSHGAEPRGAEVTMGSWMNEIEIEYRQMWGPSQVTLEWKGEAETGSAWEVVAGHRVYQEEEAFIFSIEVL